MHILCLSNSLQTQLLLIYCWPWCHRICMISLFSWGHLSNLSSLSSSCAPPPCSLVQQVEKISPCLCVSPAQQKWKHPCVINTISSTNPKHGPIWATVMKINSTCAKFNIFSTTNSMSFSFCSSSTLSNVSSITTSPLLPSKEYSLHLPSKENQIPGIYHTSLW